MHEYETFRMKDDETIAQMYGRFTLITNGLAHLGKDLSNDEMVERLVRCMPRKWDAKLAALEGKTGWGGTKLEELIGTLSTHELVFEKRCLDDERIDALQVPQKKSLALKGVAYNEDEDLMSDDEELVMFARRFNKFLGFNKRG